jgi:hypothetical protein
MPRETLDARYRFRPDQALYVIAVLAFALAHPVTIAQKPEYLGCRSWVSVDDEIDVEGSTPALTEEALTARMAAIDALIAAPSAAT